MKNKTASNSAVQRKLRSQSVVESDWALLCFIADCVMCIDLIKSELSFYPWKWPAVILISSVHAVCTDLWRELIDMTVFEGNWVRRGIELIWLKLWVDAIWLRAPANPSFHLSYLLWRFGGLGKKPDSLTEYQSDKRNWVFNRDSETPMRFPLSHSVLLKICKVEFITVR